MKEFHNADSTFKEVSFFTRLNLTVQNVRDKLCDSTKDLSIRRKMQATPTKMVRTGSAKKQRIHISSSSAVKPSAFDPSGQQPVPAVVNEEMRESLAGMLNQIKSGNPSGLPAGLKLKKKESVTSTATAGSAS